MSAWSPMVRRGVVSIAEFDVEAIVPEIPDCVSLEDTRATDPHGTSNNSVDERWPLQVQCLKEIDRQDEKIRGIPCRACGHRRSTRIAHTKIQSRLHPETSLKWLVLHQN